MFNTSRSTHSRGISGATSTVAATSLTVNLVSICLTPSKPKAALDIRNRPSKSNLSLPLFSGRLSSAWNFLLVPRPGSPESHGLRLYHGAIDGAIGWVGAAVRYGPQGVSRG